jgi:hypothetical protein
VSQGAVDADVAVRGPLAQASLLLLAGLVATHFVAFNAWASHYPHYPYSAREIYSRRAYWCAGAALLLFISAGFAWPVRARPRDVGTSEPTARHE